MLLNRIGFTILLFSLCTFSFAQKINNVWAFGDHAGLDFNTNPPGFITTESKGTTPPYYISSICDRYGSLQLYTDGNIVWNNGHQQILPDNNRWPWSGNVIPLVYPYSNNDSLYYVFGISTGGFSNQLQFLTINTKANNFNGAIVYPSSSQTDYFTVLQKNAALLLTGTIHCNQKDTWIVTYGAGSFNCFLITGSGVSKIPVTSSFPSTIIPPFFNSGWSNLKFSANGEKMIVPIMDNNSIIVFDFNNFTGKFSNPQKIKLPPEKTLEDVEVSPDGTKLYFGSHERTDPGLVQHNIYQMNLKAGSTAQIEGSIFKLNDRADRSGCTPHDCFTIYRSLQLAPDGKIYASMRIVGSKDQDFTLSTIDEPNKLEGDALYNRNSVNVNSKYRFLNYNYIRSGSFSLKQNGIMVQNKSCKDQPVNFSLLINNIDSVRWDFGDTTSGALNTSISFTPQHQYPAPGYYHVTAYITTKCVKDTAKTVVFIQDDKSVHIPEFIRDTTFCLGDSWTVDVTAPNATKYLWENSMTTTQRNLSDTGIYSIRISNECSIDYKRFHVSYVKCDCTSYIPTAFTPNKDRLNDIFKPTFKCPAKDYDFEIIDRWGGIIFKSNTPNQGWNGDVKDRQAPIGIYVWVLRYKDPNTNQSILKKGTVALLR